MKPIDESLDEVYFARRASWHRRLASWLNRQDPQSPFLECNAEVVSKVTCDTEIGARMVVNIPADALLGFLTQGRYLNAYERPVVGGAERGASPRRQTVDTLLGFGANAPDYYYGAVALGGAGVRFYGEYCLVLRPDALGRTTRVFDRNSYDLLLPPLCDVGDQAGLVRVLRGDWGRDLSDMVALKVLPGGQGNRSITVGTLSDALLTDEDFVEVHRRGTFAPPQVEEVRVAAEEVAAEIAIEKAYERGILPSPAQILWTSRRAQVDVKLAGAGVRRRVVATAGRTGRWS